MGCIRWRAYRLCGPAFSLQQKGIGAGLQSLCQYDETGGARYGAKRLENACERLLDFTAAPSISTLNMILKNGQDKLPAAETSEPQKESGPHGITRGAAYFRKGGASK